MQCKKFWTKLGGYLGGYKSSRMQLWNTFQGKTSKLKLRRKVVVVKLQFLFAAASDSLHGELLRFQPGGMKRAGEARTQSRFVVLLVG